MVFFLLVISLLLSFCDHHFLSSCEAHRKNPCINFCFHLGHIPPHPPAPSLDMFCLVFPPKPLLHTQVTRFLVAIQALEQLFQRQWTGLSRWISGSRSPPMATTCLYYNLSDTSSVFVLCAGKCKQLLHPPFLGRRGKTPKQGAERLYFALLSLSPFSPNASLLFPPFVRNISPH